MTLAHRFQHVVSAAGGGGVELHILNTLGFLLEHVEFLDIMNMCTDSFPWIRQSKDIK